MSRQIRLSIIAMFLLALVGAEHAGAQLGVSVDNWSVPDRPSKAVDNSPPVVFVAVIPCRIVDTRGPAGPYGGPALPPATTRNFDLNDGPCAGIPSNIAAYSLNLTVTETTGFGDIRVWPVGSMPPLVSTLNYEPNQTLANAAIVPAGINGAVTVVAAVSGTHLIIDINGYFTCCPNDGNSTAFQVSEPGGSAMLVTNLAGAPASSGIQGTTLGSGTNAFGLVGTNIGVSPGEGGGVVGFGGGLLLGVPNYGPSAVRGNSRDSYGLLGLSENGFGVAGSNVTGGSEQTWGGLACSDTQAVCGMGTLNVTGTKSFVEPHPTDPVKVIEYVSLEGPEAGTYFRGRARFSRGIARIALPESFRMVTAEEGLSIQVTPIGEMATYAVVRIDLSEIVVKGSRNVEFFYTVNGVRKGYEGFSPVAEKSFFAPRFAGSRMPAALSPEAKRKLVANGTYNADGTVNMETAERLGWTEKWKEPPVRTEEETRRKQ